MPKNFHKKFSKNFYNSFVSPNHEYVHVRKERRGSYSTSPLQQLQGQTSIYLRAITDIYPPFP